MMGACGARPGMDIWFTNILPDVGRIIEEIRRIMVVLPEPFAPMIPTTLFSGNVQDNPLIAATSPKFFVTSWSSIMLPPIGVLKKLQEDSPSSLPAVKWNYRQALLSATAPP